MRKFLIFMLGALCAVSVAAQETDSLGTKPLTQAELEPSYTPEQAWNAANEAYIAGEYARAEENYLRIIADGKLSAKLYFNLANALFKQEKLGKAILYYNRALRLDPSDEDIQHNLAMAESLTKDRIERVPEFFLKTWIKSLRGALSCTAWSVLSLILLVASLAFALIYLLAQRLSLRKMGFYMMATAALLFVVATAFAWSERNMLVERNEAIVMNTAVSIKSSPDRSATELFVLHEGTKVTIGETIDGWAEVRIADGRKGWIEDERIERI